MYIVNFNSQKKHIPLKIRARYDYSLLNPENVHSGCINCKKNYSFFFVIWSLPGIKRELPRGLANDKVYSEVYLNFL